MKNREKYREEIMDVNTNFCEDFIKPVILQALGMDCNDVGCAKCRVIQSIWLEEEYEEPVVDWTKVAVDTPMFVSDDGATWYRRYFNGCENGTIYTWYDGRTSWSGHNVANESWKYAKLAEEE